jgi:hypothetical protein
MPSDHLLHNSTHHAPAAQPHGVRPGWDVLWLAVLLLAQIQIGSLAEVAVLPTRYQDVVRHPWLGGLLPQAGIAALGEVSPAPGEPIGLLLIAASLGFLALYALFDLLPFARWRQIGKWGALSGIVLAAVFLPATQMILLRSQSGPASYTHDGGVIQTEATIQYLLAGKNPYSEDYINTPMAEWGFSQYRTALYHYPYLPWTFVFSAPFYWLGQQVGFYDQRIVYLLLMAAALLLTPKLTPEPRRQLALVAGLALNPVMTLDLIFGQNDSFVLCWLIFALFCWEQGRRSPGKGGRWRGVATICYGLACASKPTAWFFAPYMGFLLLADDPNAYASWRASLKALPRLLGRTLPALLVFAALLLPYVLWDAWSLYDDVWRWSNGQGETGYQIWGWGASNFVLAAGWVSDRFAAWPFAALEFLLAGPALLWFCIRQWRDNTLANACWHYGLFLLLFFYGSRFLNPNYLGFILAFWMLGMLAGRNAED